MKRDFKIFITGFIIASILMFSISGFAEGLKKSILVTLNGVNLKVNGKKVEADNLLYNGTTYVPLRAVANMLNKEVTWDGSSKTVDIDDKVIQNQAKDTSNTNNQLEIESIQIASKDVKLYEDITFIVKIINQKKLSDKYYSMEDELGPFIDIYFQGPNGSKSSVLRYSKDIDAWQGVFQGVSKDDVGTWAVSDIKISDNGVLNKSIFAALNKSIDISTLKFHVLDGDKGTGTLSLNIF